MLRNPLHVRQESNADFLLVLCCFVRLHFFFSVEPEAPPIVALCVPPRPGPGPHRRHVAPAGPPPRHTGASLDLSPASKSRRALVHAMAMTPDRLKVEILWTLYWLLCPGLAEGGLDIEPDGMGRGMNGPLGILYAPPLRWGGGAPSTPSCFSGAPVLCSLFSRQLFSPQNAMWSPTVLSI